MRLHGADAQIAAAGVGQPVFIGLIKQRAQQHDHAPGAACGLGVHGLEIKIGRAAELEVVVVEPGAFDADAAQDLHDAVDFLDAGQPAQRGGPAVDEAGAEQGDPGVLAGVDINGTGERPAAFHAEVGHLRFAELDDAAAEDRFQPLDHFQAQVLFALFHPGHGALAGAEFRGQLALGPPLLPAGIAEQEADVFSGLLSHAQKYISYELFRRL
ncbi:hypothetical protein ABIE00_000040 [Arthrobacter sp. OAP107]